MIQHNHEKATLYIHMLLLQYSLLVSSIGAMMASSSAPDGATTFAPRTPLASLYTAVNDTGLPI